MITKTITLKVASGETRTVVIHGRDERECSKLIAAKMTETSAYGFGTQSTTGRR